jgi:hypothetical protein
MFKRNESKNVELTPELAAFERQLAGLDVAPLRVDRDRLMFEAGRAAGQAERPVAATQRVAGAPRWFWPSAAAMMTAACVVLAAMLVWRDDAALVAQREAKPQAAHIPTIAESAGEESHTGEWHASSLRTSVWAARPTGGYLEKRHIALTRGVGELQLEDEVGSPFQPRNTARPATARELLRDLVPRRLTPNSNS